MKCYIAPFCGGQGTFSAWLPAHSPHGRPLVKPLCLNLRSENWQSKLGAFVSSAKPKIENDFPTPVWGSRERGHQLFPACPLLVCGGCFYWAQVSAWAAAEPLSHSHVIDGEKGQSKQSPKVLGHFFIFQGFLFLFLPVVLVSVMIMWIHYFSSNWIQTYFVFLFCDAFLIQWPVSMNIYKYERNMNCYKKNTINTI